MFARNLFLKRSRFSTSIFNVFSKIISLDFERNDFSRYREKFPPQTSIKMALTAKSFLSISREMISPDIERKIFARFLVGTKTQKSFFHHPHIRRSPQKDDRLGGPQPNKGVVVSSNLSPTRPKMGASAKFAVWEAHKHTISLTPRVAFSPN